MSDKAKAGPTTGKKAVKKRPSRSRAKVQNIMTNDVSVPIPPSNPTPRKRAGNQSKGFVQTVKEDVRSALKAVGKFVQKNASDVPPPKKRNTKARIVPPFTSPI